MKSGADTRSANNEVVDKCFSLSIILTFPHWLGVFPVASDFKQVIVPLVLFCEENYGVKRDEKLPKYIERCLWDV